MNNNPRVPYKTFEDGQIAKAIYLKNMTAMKNILNIEEVRLNGRDSKAYILFKKEVMDEFYNAMSNIFSALEAEGMVVKCQCGTTIRNGYKPCEFCNGAGHRNSDDFDDFVQDMRDGLLEEGPPDTGNER